MRKLIIYLNAIKLLKKMLYISYIMSYRFFITTIGDRGGKVISADLHSMYGLVKSGNNINELQMFIKYSNLNMNDYPIMSYNDAYNMANNEQLELAYSGWHSICAYLVDTNGTIKEQLPLV